MRSPFTVWGALLLACLLAARPASADSERHRQKAAKEAFDDAEAAYALGNYTAAADGYKHAFELAHRPGLLFNAAQSYRLGGDAKQALFFYHQYERLVPEAPNRAEVDARIAELEAALNQPAEPTPPPAPTPTRVPSPERVAALAPPPSATPSERLDGDSQRPRPIYKKWWFWTGIAVVAAGATVAIVASRSTSSGPGTHFGPDPIF